MAFVDENITTVDGVRAIELWYRAIKDISSNEPAFFQTQMRLNSPDMGVLMPDRYIPVLECTDKCADVFKLSLVQLCQAIKKFEERNVEFEWISLYMPLRMLGRMDCVKTVCDGLEKLKVKTEQVCFELPITLLNETEGMAAENIALLRRKGCHFMLTEFGGNSCPSIRLSQFPVDFVLLDRDVTSSLALSERGETAAKAVIHLVNELDAEPIAENVTKDNQTVKLFECECSYFTGELAGKYMQERFVRRRGDE